jgi:hypothetical protein
VIVALVTVLVALAVVAMSVLVVAMLMTVVVVVVVVVAAAEMLTEPPTVRGIKGWLRRPFTIEQILGPAARLHPDQATETEPPAGRHPAVRAHNAVSDRRRRKHLVCRSATITAIVDE